MDLEKSVRKKIFPPLLRYQRYANAVPVAVSLKGGKETARYFDRYAFDLYELPALTLWFSSIVAGQLRKIQRTEKETEGNTGKPVKACGASLRG